MSSVILRSRRVRAGAIIAVLILALAVWHQSRGRETATVRADDRSQRSAAPLRVSGVRVQPVPFRETIAASGTLRAEESVELQSEVNGKIIALNFTEGQPVSAGTILVKIDDSSLQASLRRARARRELAAFREQRLARLVRTGGVSQQDYDEARGELDVLDAEADLILAEIRKTEIRAPFAGVVGIRFVSIGAYVNPATRIATLQGLTHLKVDFSVPERYAPRVRTGDPVAFSVAGSALTFEAEVYAVEPRIDVATRSVLLRAVCRNPDGALLPGVFARIAYPVSQSESALLVPAIAVLSGLEERALFVERSGRAERILVELGARTTRDVQVISGLNAGDVVIISGVQQLRTGAAVTVELVN